MRAIILHDPSGLRRRTQREVETFLMEPHQPAKRTGTRSSLLRYLLAQLRGAVAEGDVLGVCTYAGILSGMLVQRRLATQGVSPSFARAMIQLEEVSPALKERICDWEGSSGLTVDEVEALLPAVRERLAFVRQTGLSLFRYDRHWAEWFAETDLHREALHLMWRAMASYAQIVQDSNDPILGSSGTQRVQDWLRAVGWEGQKVLEEKVRMAEEMVADVSALAAH
jgi:hypothetical protein